MQNKINQYGKYFKSLANITYKVEGSSMNINVFWPFVTSVTHNFSDRTLIVIITNPPFKDNIT